MIRTLSILLMVSIITNLCLAQTFVNEQKLNSRVKTAYSEKEISVKKLLSDKNISDFNFDIYIRIFKQEEIDRKSVV